MKFVHPTGSVVLCGFCSEELHMELEAKLLKMGFVVAPIEETPEEKPAPKKKAVKKESK
jgi:hypothetical protein